MRSIIFLFLVSSLLLSCEKTPVVRDSYFDSLVTSNTKTLVAMNASLVKKALIHGSTDTSSLKPDSAFWTNELDVFRQLNVFQKPAYADAYEIKDGVKDTQSNLTTQEYRATRPVPVSMVRFYYYNNKQRLKKIEAHYREDNTLYSATRHLVMEFDDIKGVALLNRYSVDGIQRMILTDSLSYSVEGKISF